VFLPQVKREMVSAPQSLTECKPRITFYDEFAVGKNRRFHKNVSQRLRAVRKHLAGNAVYDGVLKFERRPFMYQQFI
jgi:hypothetical protein